VPVAIHLPWRRHAVDTFVRHDRPMKHRRLPFILNPLLLSGLLLSGLLLSGFLMSGCGPASLPPAAAPPPPPVSTLPASPVDCSLLDPFSGQAFFLRWTTPDRTCAATSATSPDPSMRGRQQVTAGTNIDPETGLSTLGLWLSDLDTGTLRLLVSHGDALDVSEPTITATGNGVFFTARHPDHFEVHNYRFTDGALSTLLETERKVSSLVVEPVAALPLAAAQIGDCTGTEPTDVAIVETGRTVELSMVVPEFAGKWLEPVGWMPTRGLAVLVRPSGCAGPAELWMVRTPTTRPEASRVASGVTGAFVVTPPPVTPPTPITLPLARQVPT
jgi:hypothetical protein